MPKFGIFTIVLLLHLSSISIANEIQGVEHFHKSTDWYSLAQVLDFDTVFLDSLSYHTRYKIEKEYERDAYRGKTPLALYGGYRYYFRDFEVTPEEDELNSKISLGVQFKFLSEGLAGKKRKLEQIAHELTVDSLLWVESKRKRIYVNWRSALRQQSNRRVLELHTLYLKFLSDYSKVASRHYFDKKIPKEVYEEILQAEEENRALLSLYGDLDTVYSASAMPLLRLTDSPLTVHSDEATVIQHRKKKAIDNLSLNATLSGEIYPRYESREGNIVAGISFRMPVKGVKKAEDTYAKNIAQYTAQTNNERIQKQKERLTIALAEYRDAASLQIRIRSRLERRKKSVQYLLLSYKHFQSTPDFMALYRAIDQYYHSLFDIVVSKRKTLLKLIALAEMTETKQLSDITKPYEYDTAANAARNGERSLYLWKKSYDLVSAEYLLEFCHKKDIKRIYLSASRYDTASIKMKALIQGDLKIIPLFSENSWSRTEKHGRALKRIGALPDEVSEIHLDIEPHALDGWREKEYQILKEFVSLVEKIDTQYKGRISLSLPAIFPQEYYAILGKMADRIDFMIYGKSASKTIEKLEQIGDIENAAVAIRATDFSSESELEEYIDSLYKSGNNSFALFDFHSYLELVTK